MFNNCKGLELLLLKISDFRIRKEIDDMQRTVKEDIQEEPSTERSVQDSESNLSRFHDFAHFLINFGVDKIRLLLEDASFSLNSLFFAFLWRGY